MTFLKHSHHSSTHQSLIIDEKENQQIWNPFKTHFASIFFKTSAHKQLKSFKEKWRKKSPHIIKKKATITYALSENTCYAISIALFKKVENRLGGLMNWYIAQKDDHLLIKIRTK